MLKRRLAGPNHEEVFLQRYQMLRASALRLVQNDKQLAEDLLHDVFLQFTVVKPDLHTIENLDGYLYRMLRNMHLSQLRRASRMREVSSALLDFESADAGLESLKNQTAKQASDELRRICQYALLRKETSKAASVLILRFFHAYYPIEIVQVLCKSRNFVDQALCTARAEAKAYLADPNSLAFINETSKAETVALDLPEDPDDLLLDLRRAIFSAPKGTCLAEDEMQQLYHAPQAEGPDCAALSHLVSCEVCLDAANATLGLPAMATRYPGKNSQRDMRSRKKSGGGGPPAGGGEAGGEDMDGFIKTHRRRRRELLDHHPQELRISVNGFVVGAHTVNSEQSRQTLTVNLEERISFVEVFSDRDVRLLFCDIEPPPDGPGAYRETVHLNEGRTLELNVDFSESHPQVDVVYNDPGYRSVPSSVRTGSEKLPLPLGEGWGEGAQHSDRVTSASPRDRAMTLSDRLGSLISSVRAALGTPQFWTRPATVTGIFALILIAVLTFLYRRAPVPIVSAADLLARASAAEDLVAARTDQVIHRTITMEESVPGAVTGSSQTISKRRIEIWQSAEKGITARRLYDDNGQLVAGDWRRRDGVQTIYHHGARPQLQLAPEKRTGPPSINFENVWQFDIAAKDFSSLIGKLESAKVEERSDAYVISADVSTASGSNRVDSTSRRDDLTVAQGLSPGLAIGKESEPRRGDRTVNHTSIVRATLVLTKSDLHATEQTIVLRQGDEVREYRFKEATFERHAPSGVAPTVFDPEPELLSSAELETRNSKLEDELPPDTRHPTPSAATAALEVEVIDLLNRAGAFTGEQIDVSRSADGRLQVNALVETDRRKAELLAALASVRNNPAVRINIETIADAQARESRNKKSGSQPQGTVTTDQFTATENPVFNELRKRFSESEAQAFADRVIRRSIQARRHATALRQLSERFSATDLESLTAADRTRWLGLLRGHAAKFLAENESLQRELQMVFPDIGGGGDSRTLDSDREIQAAIRELYGLAVACDEDLRASFALFTNAGASAEVKTAKFWRALNTASALARSVQSAR